MAAAAGAEPVDAGPEQALRDAAISLVRGDASRERADWPAAAAHYREALEWYRGLDASALSEDDRRLAEYRIAYCLNELKALEEHLPRDAAQARMAERSYEDMYYAALEEIQAMSDRLRETARELRGEVETVREENRSLSERVVVLTRRYQALQRDLGWQNEQLRQRNEALREQAVAAEKRIRELEETLAYLERAGRDNLALKARVNALEGKLRRQREALDEARAPAAEPPREPAEQAEALRREGEDVLHAIRAIRLELDVAAPPTNPPPPAAD
jgi:chromosome segregation ATPase